METPTTENRPKPGPAPLPEGQKRTRLVVFARPRFHAKVRQFVARLHPKERK